MKAKQITTYHVKGEAKTWEKALAPEDESKSVKMIESNVITAGDICPHCTYFEKAVSKRLGIWLA